MSQAIEMEAKEGTLLQRLEAQKIPDQGFNFTAFSQPVNGEEGLIASPQYLRVNSSQAGLHLP